MCLDVALVSCRHLPEPDPDAGPLAAALAEAGIDHRVLAWDDPSSPWSQAALSVLRSCWNYPRHPERFLRWLDRTAAVTCLVNPPAVVRWNLHKRYLLDLDRAGVAVAPTVLVERGASTSLAEVFDRRGWRQVVVKPAVSAASFRTMLVGRETLAGGEAHLRALVADRDALVQAYLPAVETHGERALVWIDGELTHAVRKTPRWQGEDEAVSQRAVPIEPAEARLALRAVAAVEPRPFYARVDVVPGPDGSPVVMELELIEPSLFFPQSAAALQRFVAGLAARLGAVR